MGLDHPWLTFPRDTAMNRLCLVATLTGSILAAPARAELGSLDIKQREPYAGGSAFAEVGPYEKLSGIARFAVDPSQPQNGAVVDLRLAPRNADGKVEFEADVVILTPKDLARGNRALLYDVNNRGIRVALEVFNGGDPGNGFLFRRGYTVVWCGWIGELLPGGGRLLLRAPVATEHGKPIRGLVRYEIVADAPVATMPLSRRDGHGSYSPVADAARTGTLTWRMRETDERVAIPCGQWSLERLPVPQSAGGVPGTLGQVRLHVAGGFRPGYLYELICEAEGPLVQGLGYCAVRDLVSFLRYDAGAANPLHLADGKPAMARAHAFGVSQSGRFLRDFLYLDFNHDGRGRLVFDGLMPHVAGGGLGFFNHRFAQPTRHSAQHEEHLYPTDRFPFTYGDLTDPFTMTSDGILRRAASDAAKPLPKVMHTQTAAEYWHRSGSLVHTDPLGTRDAAIPDNVRIYAFGGTQHRPAADPPQLGAGDNLPNPADYRPLLRALLDDLDDWVARGTSPPASVYPRTDRGTLVGWKQADTGFPALPGVRYPEVIQQPSSLDFGPDFDERGLLTLEPPRTRGRYIVRVPKSDPDGNDLGCLLVPDVALPLATYTGWNLRRREVGAEGSLVGLTGSYIPFAVGKSERVAAGDSRESLEERYGTFENYRERYARACAELVKARCLLPEDVDRLLDDRESQRARFDRGQKQKRP
jgi:hypothetical protein